MGEYEPHDSRNVTLKQDRAPGEPPRTGPQEGETRRPAPEQAGETELEQDGRGEEAEQVADSCARLSPYPHGYQVNGKVFPTGLRLVPETAGANRGAPSWR